MSAARKIKQTDLLSLFVVDQLKNKDDLGSYLEGVLQQCTQWFRTSSASIFLATEDPKIHRLAAKYGPAARTPDGATIRMGKGFAGLALEDGQPKILVNPEATIASRRKDIGSSMIVPLKDSIEGPLVGVLNLARGHDELHFDADDLKFAEAVASQIALAIRNAQLFAESRHLSESFRVVMADLGFALLSVGREGRIGQFNPECAIVLGSMPSIGESATSFFARVTQAFEPCLSNAYRDGRSGVRHQSRHEIEGRTWSITATPLQSGGCTLAIQDVTEIEREQREMDRIKRLAEVGQMTATIAHEIRNPLTGVRSAAKMIRESPELSEEFAEIIETESVKLSLLCDEFLEFARPLRMELSDCSLAEVAEGVRDRVNADFETAGVHFESRIPRDLPNLSLDARRIEQVLRNLLLNALQATPKGGTVVLEVASNRISIRDTGCGMSEETISRLFSPFFTTKTKGTGLGLSMVRKIVDAHDAHIEVNSKLGIGTEFEVKFSQGIRN